MFARDVRDSSVKPAACKKSPLIEEMPDRAEEYLVSLEKGDFKSYSSFFLS